MEVECAAQRIRFLIRKKEYRYREIAVIASDMNLYADEIEKTFREYEIPVFMDYKRNVLLNSFVEYIRSLLAMAEQNFSAESVFRFLRTDLVGFTGEELDLLKIMYLRWASVVTKNGRKNGSAERRIRPRKSWRY